MSCTCPCTRGVLNSTVPAGEREKEKKRRKEGVREGHTLIIKARPHKCTGDRMNRKPSPADLQGILQCSFSGIPFH